MFGSRTPSEFCVASGCLSSVLGLGASSVPFLGFWTSSQPVLGLGPLLGLFGLLGLFPAFSRPGPFLGFFGPRASSGVFWASGPLRSFFWAWSLFWVFRSFWTSSRPLPSLFWALGLFWLLDLVPAFSGCVLGSGFCGFLSFFYAFSGPTFSDFFSGFSGPRGLCWLPGFFPTFSGRLRPLAWGPLSGPLLSLFWPCLLAFCGLLNLFSACSGASSGFFGSLLSFWASSQPFLDLFASLPSLFWAWGLFWLDLVPVLGPRGFFWAFSGLGASSGPFVGF